MCCLEAFNDVKDLPIQDVCWRFQGMTKDGELITYLYIQYSVTYSIQATIQFKLHHYLSHFLESVF